MVRRMPINQALLQCHRKEKKRKEQRQKHQSKVRSVPGVLVPSNGVQKGVDPQPWLRTNSPRLIKYDALILRKKRREKRGWRIKRKGGGRGVDGYVYADMYFKASISPILRRFVTRGVYIALLSIHNGFCHPSWYSGEGEQWITETLCGIDNTAGVVFDYYVVLGVKDFEWRKKIKGGLQNFCTCYAGNHTLCSDASTVLRNIRIVEKVLFEILFEKTLLIYVPNSFIA